MNQTALLMIDVQNCMFNPAEPVYNSEMLLTNLTALIDRARAAETPVIYIQHCGPAGAPHAPGTPGWEIHPAIAPHAGELIVQKTTPDSFYQTTLKDELTTQGIEKLVIAGIQTRLLCGHHLSPRHERGLYRDLDQRRPQHLG